MADEKRQILKELKAILKSFSRGMDVRKDDAKSYELYGKKKVTVSNREVDGMYFATTMLRTSSVALYFFPIYTHPREFKGIAPELRKRMSGKSCFQITKADKALFGHIARMVKKGAGIYRKAGWI